MNQVHKEPLERVENALPNRTDPNIEIFGTEGIPEEASRDHLQRVIQQYHQNAAERQAVTGNIQPGAKGVKAPKRPKLAQEGNLKEKLKEHLAQKAAGQPGDFDMQDAPTQNDSGYPQPYSDGMAMYSQNLPSQAPYAYPTNASPSQNSAFRPPSGGPSIPTLGGPPGATAQPTSSQDPRIQVKVASLQNVGFAATQAQGQPEVTMADAPQPAGDDTAKRLKKEKGIKMLYQDNEVSPEEKMARMSRYAFDRASHQPVVLGDTTGALTGTVQE